MNDNKKYLIIGIFAIAFFGGTIAYWQWETSTEQQTQVTFTVENDFSCSVDGGGDITSTDVMLAPASCTNEKYAIQRTITTNATITGSNMSVLMDLWLDVNSIDDELKNSTNFKYALTSNPDSCTEDYITGGTFTGTTAPLLNDKIYSSTKEDTYYLYIWLDEAEENPNTQGKTFSLSLNGSCTSQEKPNYEEAILNGVEPVLETGMIPITLSEDGVATTADLSKAWYSYGNKQWANAVLVSNENRANYYESDGVTIKPNQPVADSDILAYYVWIPKYSYKMNSESGTGNESLISISFEETTPEGYTAHPAFTFGDTELNGIWVGKFETSHSSLSLAASSLDTNNLACTETSCANAFGLVVKPNVQSLRYNNISNMFYASRLMSASGNPYGLDATETDTHMMKNSEWGAVAYLSHSAYGLGKEIYINNSSGYYTGRSGGAIGGTVSTVTGGSYTWIGQPVTGTTTYGTVTDATLGTNASTTGNVTGVYDMSGGAWEYVMGNYNGTIGSSGFTTLPDSKYYDLYSSTQFTGNNSTNMDLCTLETCGGHALHETAGWYSDYALFVHADYPWFRRGGGYGNGANTGMFSVGCKCQDKMSQIFHY